MITVTIRSIPQLSKDKVKEFRKLLDENNPDRTKLTEAQQDFLATIENVSSEGYIELSDYEFCPIGYSQGNYTDDEKEIADLLAPYVPHLALQALSFCDDEDAIYGYYFMYGKVYSLHDIMNDEATAILAMEMLNNNTEVKKVFKAFQLGIEMENML